MKLIITQTRGKGNLSMNELTTQMGYAFVATDSQTSFQAMGEIEKTALRQKMFKIWRKPLKIKGLEMMRR